MRVRLPPPGPTLQGDDRLSSEPSLQERFSPRSICFGCGPANEHGLRIASHRVLDGDRPGELVARWRPQPEHAAFEGVLNGGIVGALLDCHSNWTGAIHLMDDAGADRPPGCVTADMALRFRRPTPMDAELELHAWPVEVQGDRVVVDAELRSLGIVTATCRATFVAVGPDHPAYSRWR